jgi:polyribonucleotide nucleotidyltransferase
MTVELAPGKKISFETGRVSRQAAGAVMLQAGDTMALCTTCASRGAEAGFDFLPLRVDYAEKFLSVGRIVGGFCSAARTNVVLRIVMSTITVF